MCAPTGPRVTSHDTCLCGWWTEVKDREMKAKDGIVRTLGCGRPCDDRGRCRRSEGGRSCMLWSVEGVREECVERSSVRSVSVRVFCGEAGERKVGRLRSDTLWVRRGSTVGGVEVVRWRTSSSRGEVQHDLQGRSCVVSVHLFRGEARWGRGLNGCDVTRGGSQG